MQEFSIGTTDAILIGSKSESVFLFLHGNGGSKEEAIAFAQVAVPHGYQVIGIDVPVMGKPWEVLKILEVVKDFLKKNYKTISIRANSIGAWFSMVFALFFTLNGIFCHLNIKKFAKVVCKTKNFCNFVLGNHSILFVLFVLWLLQR